MPQPSLLKFGKTRPVKTEPDKNAVEFLKSQKKGRLLDIGCGEGLESAYAASLGFDVTAIDSDYESIKIAKEARRGAKFRYIDFFAFAKTAAKDQFDVVIDNCFSHCLQKSRLEKYYLELSKILKYRGMLYIKAYSDKGNYAKTHCPNRRWTKIDGKYYYFFSKEEIEDRLKKRGFEITNYEHVYEGDFAFNVIHARLRLTKL
ncbi:MAG: class I SAM-dependent methyltransferase [Candidatus Woesearchaeota archaeon]